MNTFVYLDNAATSFPKPQSVINEVSSCISSYCGNPGRGSHMLAMKSADKIFECRTLLSDFFGCSACERVCFTQNTTYSINTLIKGLLTKGDHVIISDLEHNSVYRPIYKLAQEGIIEYDVFSSMCGDKRASPTRICAQIARLLRKNTRLVICTHQSNICSYSLPIWDIGHFCRRHGILFAVDAAQSAGHLPINMEEMCIDALCLPAHKGLYGIQGAGALLLSENITLDTLAEGGNGLSSLLGEMPNELPERFEAGTPPTPSIVGLCEGIKVISKLGLNKISCHEMALFESAAEQLSRLPDIKLHMPQYSGSVLLFSHRLHSSEKLASMLGDIGICVRGGFHCTALGHRTLGTMSDGAVRASFGIFNDSDDVNRLVSALKNI